MNRKKFIKYIEKYGFLTTGRFSGSHEIFKSERYCINFAVPSGDKEIRKGIFWAFEKEMKRHEELQMRSK